MNLTINIWLKKALSSCRDISWKTEHAVTGEKVCKRELNWGTATHTSGVSTTRETVAYVTCVAGTVPFSRTCLLAASILTAAAPTL